jgi:hypothetical protein
MIQDTSSFNPFQRSQFFHENTFQEDLTFLESSLDRLEIEKKSLKENHIKKVSEVQETYEKSTFQMNEKLSSLYLNKLEEIQEIFKNLRENQELQIMQEKDKHLEAQLENSKLKNEILKLETEIITLRSSVKKNSLFKEIRSNSNLKSYFHSEILHKSLETSASLKSLSSNLDYSQERLSLLLKKVHKSTLKFHHQSSIYSLKISTLNSKFSKLQQKITENELKTSELLKNLSLLKSQNKKISSSLPKKSLEILQLKNSELSSNFSRLQRLIKKS